MEIYFSIVVLLAVLLGPCIPSAAFAAKSKRRPIPTPPLDFDAVRFPVELQSTSKDVEEFGIRDAKWQERSKRWVILVDDEEAIRSAVGQFLFDQGYQVTACPSAKIALNECRTKRVISEDGTEKLKSPDVIVSDIRMPEMDGLELLGEIRSDKRLVEVPVVLLTAKGMAEDRIAGFKAGADAYVPKPFDPEELLSIIDNVILRHESLNGKNVKVEDLKKDLDEIKFMLLEKGGGGIGPIGPGWVADTSVFLTPDERNVLELLCKGLMTKEIAKETLLSTRRVEQLLTSMFRKTDTSNRTELVRWAVATGNVQI